MTVEPSFILTAQQYADLLAVQTEPDQLLRDTNTELKRKLDACTKQLAQGSFDHSPIDAPLHIVDDTLVVRSMTDFVVLYNNLGKPTLGDTDKAVFDYLSLTASLFNLKPPFGEQSKLKQYRVSLQKSNTYLPGKYAGRIILTKER